MEFVSFFFSFFFFRTLAATTYDGERSVVFRNDGRDITAVVKQGEKDRETGREREREKKERNILQRLAKTTTTTCGSLRLRVNR